MNKQIIRLLAFLVIVYFFVSPQSAQAVIPPDFTFNTDTQVFRFFSIVTIFFLVVFGIFFYFFRNKFYAIKYKKTILALVFLLIIGASLLSSYFYAAYKQRDEYQKWLEESQKYATGQDNLDREGYKSGDEVVNNPNGSGDGENKLVNKDQNDQLNIGKESKENIDTSLNKFVSSIDSTDDSSKFISEYYKNIANGNYERAYEMSKKAVDYNTFRGWYASTTKITLDKLVRIDEKRLSVELTLFEGDVFTRYGVLMTLSLRGTMPARVEKSEVKILAQGIVENNVGSINKDKASEEYTFFNNNESKNIIISNQEFKTITDSAKSDYIVLDARENIEYENGYFPGSTHIRFADIKAGRWIELPKDKLVYVMCWSGIRGKEVAEFLRTKKIVASYLENGANGWVDFGGKWIGSIKFAEKYTDSKYTKLFDTDEIKDKLKEGVVLIDTREPYKFKRGHIAGSINIPIMYTPSIEVEEVLNQVPAKSNIITVCDGYVNCFDAKITGVELEQRGHQFLGRYNKPWEY